MQEFRPLHSQVIVKFIPLRSEFIYVGDARESHLAEVMATGRECEEIKTGDWVVVDGFANKPDPDALVLINERDIAGVVDAKEV